MRVRAALRKYVEALPWLFYKFRIIQRIFDSDNTFARVEDTLDLSELTIGDNGNWTISGVDTGKTSRGEQGYTPYIQSGTWWIDGVDTNEAASGAEFLGIFESYSDAIADIEEFKTGDFFVVKTTSIPRVTQVFLHSGTEFTLISQMKEEVFIEGLEVIKNPNNLDNTMIQNLDYCEGWVSTKLFVNGTWKGSDNPSLTQLQDKNNWSEFIEIE